MKNNAFKGKNTRMVPVRLMVGYTVLAVISGLSGFAFISTVNKVISMSISTDISRQLNFYLAIFIGATIIFFITRRWLSAGIIYLSQNIYWGIRRDVINLVLKAPYRKLQEYKGEVYSTLTADVANVTNASFMVITFFSAIILIISCLIYMAFLSLILFGISCCVIVAGIALYLLRSRKSNEQFKVVRELERNFINGFNTILGGAKEISVNPKKGTDIYEGYLSDIMDRGEKTNTKAFLKYLNSELISEMLFYSLITFILIYSGNIFHIPLGTIVNFVFVLLYLMGPIVSVMTIMPAMNRATVSLKKMSELRTALRSSTEGYDTEMAGTEKYHGFRSLEIKDYSFSFGEEKFSVGPVNMNINRNEIVFIHGGNGAGKTTFINTILKLYDIEDGKVYVDGQQVPQDEMDCLKSMFSPVFSDFFLFDNFYGIKDVNLEKAARYIRIFELDEKVLIRNGRFSTIDLSTGQRKRLALINALLENRPIIVLDEWAADQDPHFRRKFYKEILPMISREEDKTIIAITHDDRYFHLGDKLMKMEYGQLIEINKTQLDNV
ncbi:cyclic peptide export ABC transporter [Chitinophaga tropicalis]|uniref:Cyclic peptide export ABC transporter n=1 Tax=Chitinophaga tropicalis TaxID=2683588 RepID=A0A7K1U2U2_9BACT|nr:cyclic peptide export ABC transporter [Chitinophaga tropicalis]MVT08682.1 cyclic peptide export ABC transporter [Chitinophaga tropicalis]